MKKKIITKKRMKQIVNFKEYMFAEKEVMNLLYKIGVSVMGKKILLQNMSADANREYEEVRNNMLNDGKEAEDNFNECMLSLLKKYPDLKVIDLATAKGAKIELDAKKFMKLMEGLKR